jgi:hypothetical protein
MPGVQVGLPVFIVESARIGFDQFLVEVKLTFPDLARLTAGEKNVLHRVVRKKIC